MSQTQVSIIIPHYNSVELLEKMIASIPENEDVEILLIDDNSSEGLEQLDKIVHSRDGQIAFFRNEPGKNSAGACRNIGLEHAKGKWLLFADADDYFVEGFYNVIAKYFEAEEDIIYFIPTSINLETQKEAFRHVRYQKLVESFLNSKSVLDETRLRYHQEAPWSKMIRRRIVEEDQVRFDTTKVANDVMFSIKAAHAAKTIGASNEVIYCVTRQPGTLTTVVNAEKFYIRLGVFLDKYHFLKKNLTQVQWKTVDLLGRPYIKMARNYGLGKMKRIALYFYLLKQGVRIDVSRKWTLSYVVGKLKEKVSEHKK